MIDFNVTKVWVLREETPIRLQPPVPKARKITAFKKKRTSCCGYEYANKPNTAGPQQCHRSQTKGSSGQLLIGEGEFLYKGCRWPCLVRMPPLEPLPSNAARNGTGSSQVVHHRTCLVNHLHTRFVNDSLIYDSHASILEHFFLSTIFLLLL